MKTTATKDSGLLPPAARGTRSPAHVPLSPTTRIQRQQLGQIVQPKLTVGRPDDAYEKEADHVADRIVANQPVPDISPIASPPSSQGIPSLRAEDKRDDEQTDVRRQAEEEEEQVQQKLIQRQAEEEEEKVQPRLIQRQAEEEEEQVQSKPIQRQAEEEEEQVQPKLIQRQAEEEEEQVQQKLIQRQAEEEEEKVQPAMIQRLAEEEEEPVQASAAEPSTQMASQAIRSPSAGSPLRPDVRNTLESGMGADLSGVRVHEDSAAQQAAASIRARAFTHEQDIWLGAGQSQSDLHLMAHETTHVVQQAGGLRAASADISPATPRVQRLWNPISAVAGVVGDAVEWVGDTIGDAVNYIKEKASELVSRMPGYSLFTVINGSDPITGQSVDRNGRNFIEAGLDVIPGGRALKDKLEEQGTLEQAAEWLDLQIAELDFNPSEIGAQLLAFWDSLGIADATRIPTVMRRLLGIIRPPVERLVRFAINVGAKLLQIVKDYLISSLIDFIKERTTAYPLLTVILEHDPISGEVVERTPINLLRGFMQLSESGTEQLRQMEESGSLQRAADWLDGAVARLDLSWETLVEGFMAIWDSVGIHSLLDPVGVFREIYETFAAPAFRIVNFVYEVAVKVLQLIKDALIRRLVAYARTIRGYPLLTVILGRDPFSNEPVERTTANIIRGFMSLMDGGEEQFQEMQQTGAIARMTARIENALANLNFTWEYIKGLFVRAWESFSLQDLVAPLAAFARLMRIFSDPLLRLISFVGEVIRVVIEVVMKVMNFPIDLINNIITRAMEAIEDIKADPIGFLKNLLRAVKAGFVKFFDNIATHLLNGVTGWLFRELEDAGISPPADLSLRSILGFVMDVLGITMDKIFQKLAEKIGQERVDRIRRMINRLTGIWRFISDVMTRGPVAIWEYIQEKISNLWNVVLDAVRNWVVTRIIERVVAKLLSMLDPTGIMAVVNGFIAFYNAVQSFIAYLREMLEIVNSFVEGVAEIARGSVETAANFLEGSLARAVPVAVGFLANQVGLSGIGRKIGEMIERVREMVDQGLDWLIDKAVSAGSALLNMGRGAVAAVANWWRARKTFSTEDGKSHSLRFQGRGASANLILRSDPIEIGRWIATKQAADLPAGKATALANVQRLVAEVDAVKAETATSPRSMDVILGELSTNIQAILGTNILAEAKAYPKFASDWFKPSELVEFIMNAEGVSNSTARSRTAAWKDTGALRTWQSNNKDGNKRFSFVEASKDRDVPKASRRTIYGFGDNIDKDSAPGWSVMSMTLDRERSEANAVRQNYRSASWYAQNPGWIDTALADDEFRKTKAMFKCARLAHGMETKKDYFTWEPAIMGHDDSDHEGASGFWNAEGHKNDRRANMTWNKQVSSYWGPEHHETSSWSGGLAKEYNPPTKESHRMWWDSKSANWYGKKDSSYTFFLKE